jgi:hypothetical protein
MPRYLGVRIVVIEASSSWRYSFRRAGERLWLSRIRARFEFSCGIVGDDGSILLEKEDDAKKRESLTTAKAHSMRNIWVDRTNEGT